jgi:hypothetical protein
VALLELFASSPLENYCASAASMLFEPAADLFPVILFRFLLSCISNLGSLLPTRRFIAQLTSVLLRPTCRCMQQLILDRHALQHKPQKVR